MIINRFSGMYTFLSNFYPVTVTLDGIEYSSVEHAYQAAKTLNSDLRITIKYISNPGKVKSAGRSLKLRDDWEQVKLDVMLDLIRQKFKDPILRIKLLDTKDQELIEGNYWHDNFYGDCFCDNCKDIAGKNNLGKILMMVRDEIRQNYYI